MTADEQTPDLNDIDYRTSKLEAIWNDIQDLLTEHGTLSGEQLGEKLDAEKYGYTEQTLANDILSKMRTPLHDQGFIEVDREDGRIVKKNWRLS